LEEISLTQADRVNLNPIQTDAMTAAGVHHDPGTSMLKEAGVMPGSTRREQNQGFTGVAAHQHHFAPQWMLSDDGTTK